MSYARVLNPYERYAPADDGGMTCEEIAELLGISKSAVHKIEERALRKLRRNAKAIKLLRECGR